MSAIKAYDKGNFQECLKQSQDVLKIDPENEEAEEIRESGKEKLVEAEISSLIDQYVQSLKINAVDFYKMHCAPQLYEEIRQGR